tara:strand:- start:127 stop:597 length:471 start_codon:yes stop_codon:yes gene_type:complete
MKKVFAYILTFIILFLALFIFLFDIYVVPTDSMSPILRAGDVCVFQSYLYGKLKRSDIVLYWNERTNEDAQLFCSRISGLPNDRISFRDGQIYVNKKKYLHKNIESHVLKERLETSVIQLESDQLYLLSDSIKAVDSIYLGPIDQKKIKGKILFKQ